MTQFEFAADVKGSGVILEAMRLKINDSKNREFKAA
jgi:hypothetical protein